MASETPVSDQTADKHLEVKEVASVKNAKEECVSPSTDVGVKHEVERHIVEESDGKMDDKMGETAAVEVEKKKEDGDNSSGPELLTDGNKKELQDEVVTASEPSTDIPEPSTDAVEKLAEISESHPIQETEHEAGKKTENSESATEMTNSTKGLPENSTDPSSAPETLVDQEEKLLPSVVNEPEVAHGNVGEDEEKQETLDETEGEREENILTDEAVAGSRPPEVHSVKEDAGPNVVENSFPESLDTVVAEAADGRDPKETGDRAVVSEVTEIVGSDNSASESAEKTKEEGTIATEGSKEVLVESDAKDILEDEKPKEVRDAAVVSEVKEKTDSESNAYPTKETIKEDGRTEFEGLEKKMPVGSSENEKHKEVGGATVVSEVIEQSASDPVTDENVKKTEEDGTTENKGLKEIPVDTLADKGNLQDAIPEVPTSGCLNTVVPQAAESNKLEDFGSGTVSSEVKDNAGYDSNPCDGNMEESKKEDNGTTATDVLVDDEVANSGLSDPSAIVDVTKSIDSDSKTETGNSFMNPESKFDEDNGETVGTEAMTPTEENKVQMAVSDSATELAQISSAKQNTSGTGSVEKLDEEHEDVKEAMTGLAETSRDLGVAKREDDNKATSVKEPASETQVADIQVNQEEPIDASSDNLEKNDAIKKTDAESLVETSKDAKDLTSADVEIPKQDVVHAKSAHRSSNIIKKVKHSIVKAKKAILGKSPSSKNASSETKDEVKEK